MDSLQFYPTPKNLARRAWGKFKNRDFVRVLEPHAGNGDLALAHPDNDDWRGRRVVLPDCCEIDITRHATLRENNLNVVGMDFLQFQSGAIYSHCIMNPPFNEGVKHVLKAWNILWDGEIVAIINAETIRNPFSAERKLLVNLIEQHGEVEFIEGAFSVEDAERRTAVDVALVRLCKQADVNNDIIGLVLDELKRDAMTSSGLSSGYREAHEVALPNSLIENSVAVFNAAVRVMREAVFAEARSQYYVRLLGDTMAARNGDAPKTDTVASVDYVRNEVGKRYDELKDRAWSGILRSSNVTSKLSSAAQKRVESAWQDIQKLEFTVPAIYGFLCGIVESRGQIQIQMCCDVFDLITKYHADNTVYYKGWKSNSKHRTCGMRIKTTRFILPGHGGSYGPRLSWESNQLLGDFDKVFAMLDGKYEAGFGLVAMFDQHFDELRSGKRVSSDYFEARYYPGAGTIHFFPRSKKLIDRLNLLVGRQRAWLPPEGERVSDAFWIQYQDAEKFDKQVRTEIDKGAKNTNYWNHPLHHIGITGDDERKAKAEAAIDEAITAVLERHGINVDSMLENVQQDLLMLKWS